VAGRKLGSGEKAEVVPGEAIELGSTLLVVQREPGSAPHGPRVRRPLSTADIERLVGRLAASTISVLLLGETGVGKKVLARRLHELSTRRTEPFLQLNCAAFAERLLEAELFGQDKGAGAGGEAARPGHLEAADKGTLFLDEVGALPAGLQAKLLRALEQREVIRLGSTVPRPVDVRILSATNLDLERAMHQGTFRRDLYFRLNGFELRVPPLRERVEEIAGLARAFIEARCKQDGRPAPPLSPDALRELEGYPWPGNVRELRNVVERAVIVCFDGAILPEHLPPLQLPGEKAPRRATLKEGLEHAERRRIAEALEACGGNREQAAAMLGISRRTLGYRLTQYRLAHKPTSRRPPRG
jgi:transcriptional regulator with PAS, ATPase and Fis domain